MRTLFARNGSRARAVVVVGSCLAALSASGCNAVVSNLGPQLQRHDEKHAAKLPEDACSVDDGEDCARKCAAGFARSCNTLAVMYEYGFRTRPDFAQASNLYRTSCSGDFAQGCTNLGWMYALGKGVDRDQRVAMLLFTKAFQGYRLACMRGEIEGCLFAVSHLREGLIDADDDRLELALVRRACELGHGPSCSEASAR